jgi:hypothetical protein
MDLSSIFDDMTLEKINEYIATEQAEHLQLEFKSIASANLRSADDKRNYAKCLSGFANSSGGIVIWGVRATGDGANYKIEGAPIVGLREFLMRLNQMAGEAVTPAVDGVRSKAIFIDQDKGFAATLVPESASVPHMAKLGENRYYKRSGESFYCLEHFDLEDMFGRRAKPKLSPGIIRNKTPDGLNKIDFYVINSGRAVAKHAELFIELINVNVKGVDHPLQNVSHLNPGRVVFSFKDNVGVIHPNLFNVAVGSVTVDIIDRGKPMEVRTSIYCEHMAVQSDKVTFDP